MLEIEWAGAKKDDGGAISLGDIDDDVRKNEIAEADEGGAELFFVAGFVGFDDRRTKLDHAEVVKTQKRRGQKNERDKN